MPAQFVQAIARYGVFKGTTENRELSQREKLEEAIINLATALGEETVERASAQSGTIYRVSPDSFQSASNTIVSLSKRLAERYQATRRRQVPQA